MDADIGIDTLDRIIGSRVTPYKKFKSEHRFSKYGSKVGHLLYVLELSYDYPKLEIYLKKLLENFSIGELNNLDGDDNNYTILHHMASRSSNISLNSFEIIINFGISVNSQTKYGVTPLHCFRFIFSVHFTNIITLFAKYGANFNFGEMTFLDEIVSRFELVNSKNIIMTLIDHGAETKNISPCTDRNVLEFVESYRSNSIKPAIKK